MGKKPQKNKKQKPKLIFDGPENKYLRDLKQQLLLNFILGPKKNSAFLDN